jgi:hypothetical protein
VGSGGAKPADSLPIARCTLAASVKDLNVTTSPAGPSLVWTHNGASKYDVIRFEQGTNTGGETVATVDPPKGGAVNLGYVDASAVPGKTYTYRIDAENCDGLRAQGGLGTGVAAVPCPVDDSGVYVRAGVAPGAGNGSKASPFGTIGEALKLVTALRNRVLISSGQYDEFVDIPTGAGPSVLLFGGYEPSFATCAHGTKSQVNGGDTDRLLVTASSENGPVASVRPIVLSDGPGVSVRLDSIALNPGSRACGGGAACLFRLSAAWVRGNLALNDVDVRSAWGSGAAGALLGPQFQVFAGGTVDVTNSVLYGVGDTCPDTACGATLVTGAVLRLSSSRALGSGDSSVPSSVCAVGGATVTIDKSFVRGSGNGWMPGGSCAVGLTNGSITNSIVAGQTTVNALQSVTVVDSLLYGTAKINGGLFINDVLATDSGVPIDFTLPCPPCEYLFSNVVRGNLFLVPAAMAGTEELVGASDKKGNVKKSDVNNSKAWFGFDTPGFGANLVLTDATYLFHKDPSTGALDNDPNTPQAFLGPNFPFRPGYFDLSGSPTSLYTGGIDPTEYVAPVTTDIDGHDRSTTKPFSAGPYYGVDLGKP